MRHTEVELTPEKKAALDEFDEKFEQALSELFDAGVDQAEIMHYFGPSMIGRCILHQFIERKHG